MKFQLVILFKRCPHVQQTMLSLQYDRHVSHCVLGSVSSNSNSSPLPTTWIIRFDSGLNGMFAWFCRRSCWRACRSQFFWINSRTVVLCACFTTECGKLGIRKSRFTSFSIVCSWLESSWFTTDCPSITKSSDSNVESYACVEEKLAWDSVGTHLCSFPKTGCPVISCVISMLKVVVSSDFCRQDQQTERILFVFCWKFWSPSSNVELIKECKLNAYLPQNVLEEVVLNNNIVL